MTLYTLTLVDVRRIQPYLFSANELKQSLGGSMLVELATHNWIVDALPKQCNVRMNEWNVQFDSTKKIDTEDAEAIFLGGGNAAILFKAHDLAVTFAGAYTRKVLTDAPGLEVAVAHVDFDWDQSDGLKNAWEKMQTETMPAQKEGRAVSQGLLGLGVTAECAFTGRPAVRSIKDLDDPLRDVLRDVLVSAEALARHDDATVSRAKERIKILIPLQKYEYPDKFDDLGGEKGRSSYIAVVHADGNSMGKRIEQFCTDPDNRTMLEKMHTFSEAINGISKKAMQATVKWLEDQVKKDTIYDRWYTQDGVHFPNGHFPVRPIIFGGDDLTFVCEGRLGLALAHKYLQELNKNRMPDPDGQPVYACAGVAIVSSHYPFSRAYQLAEELAQEAKKKAREYDPAHAAVSLINWHVSTSGLTRNWEDIKQREFLNGALLLRPLVVNYKTETNIEAWRTWDVFIGQVEYFRSQWKFGRNKLKDLREILRQGDGATSKFTNLNGDLPDCGISGLEEVRKKGWLTDQCLYFDALEVDDHFILPKEA